MNSKIIEGFLAAATFMKGVTAHVRADADSQHEITANLVDKHPDHDLEEIENARGAKEGFDVKEAKKRIAELTPQHDDLSAQYDKAFAELGEDPTPEQTSKLELLHTQRTVIHHERAALQKQVDENDFGARTKRNTPNHDLEESFKNHSQTEDEEEQLKHKAREHLKKTQRDSFNAEREKLSRGKKKDAEGEEAGAEESAKSGTPEKDGKKAAPEKSKPESPKGKDAPAKKPAKGGKDAKSDGAKKEDGKAESSAGKGEEAGDDGETPIEELEEAIEIHQEFMQFLMKRFPDLLKDMEKQPLDDLAKDETKKKEQSEQQAKQAEDMANMSEEERAAALQQEESGNKREDQKTDKQHAHEIKLEKIKQAGKSRADRQNPLSGERVTRDANGRKVAAGILFIARHGLVLMGLRAEDGAYQRHWGLFGGHHEEGESLEVTAIREVMEEASYVVNDPSRLQLIATTDDGETVFSYFAYTVDEPFQPRLNNEHTDWRWVEFGKTPDSSPLIPKFEEVLNSEAVKLMRKAKMTELDVIRAMARGHLESPQVFYNMNLYKMRITGTGTSFRHGRVEVKDDAGKVLITARKDEFVFRTPEQFLNEEFMERCNGIPLIYDHPEKAILNSKEFHDRIVGIMVHPWIEDDAVWGIAKVYDDDTKLILGSKKMSTSPSVVFLDRDSTSTIALNDGAQILIERVPTLLDHLAICDVGVWDKGGDPTGVESQTVVED